MSLVGKAGPDCEKGRSKLTFDGTIPPGRSGRCTEDVVHSPSIQRCLYRYGLHRNEGHRVNEKNLLPAVKYGRGSMMLWGCIAACRTGNIPEEENGFWRLR